MYRFYVEQNAVTPSFITIAGEDYNHIKNVLRMREGEEVIVCDGAGKDYHCRLAAMEKNSIQAEIIEVSDTKTELPVKLILFQGMPKKDKMELIVQKAVELGAAEIVPVMMKRTIVKLEDEKAEKKKRERWQTIARAAAMQSMRGIIPQVMPALSMKEALKTAAELDAVLVPYENAEGVIGAKKTIDNLVQKQVKSIGIFIGPEGGFEEEEIEVAKATGAEIISLGHRILRTETAGLTTLSLLMFAFEAGKENE